MHHTLGAAGGAGGEKHGGHIVGLTRLYLLLDKWRVFGSQRYTILQQRIQTAQTLRRVIAQAARVVVVNARKRRAIRLNFLQLVDLLLVFHHSKPHFGVVDGEDIFRGCRVLVQRHRYAAQRLHGQHAGGQPGAVGADDEHMLAALQTVARQPMGYLPDHGVQVSPIQGLPDTVFFFAQRGIARALARMFLK